MSRVLVVDDDSGMRAALEARFIRRGWRVEPPPVRAKRWKNSVAACTR